MTAPHRPHRAAWPTRQPPRTAAAVTVAALAVTTAALAVVALVGWLLWTLATPTVCPDDFTDTTGAMGDCDHPAQLDQSYDNETELWI